MPIFKSIAVNSQTNVKIWKIEESFDDLMRPLKLKPESLKRVDGMKSEIHQRGFLSVRHLLREFGYTDADLYYDGFGKPHLKDGKQISISHSFIFSALIISDREVGIDVEKQRQKIKWIASKFISYEFQYLEENDADYVKKLTIIWCAKESLYKLYTPPGMSFKQHALVIPFMKEDGFTNAWIDHSGNKLRYDINFLEFEGFTCAYATT